MATRVLLIGSGGREHAIAHRLAASASVDRVYVAPGNAGTRGEKIQNVKAKSFAELLSFAQEHDISLVVPGPEHPLVDGIADAFKKIGVPCFGPSMLAARIEGSKAFAKEFMKRHNVATADFHRFNDYDAAKTYIENQDPRRIVIKASGLAAGKGVLLPETIEEALSDLKSIMLDNAFGTAGDEIVVEERLDGEEVSILAITDGYTVVPLAPAQDHKRAFDGDQGPNTGGMGAYAPAPIASSAFMREIQEKVLQRTVDGMRRDGIRQISIQYLGYPFVGVLYAGLMITSAGPKVLEFNCRMGDPETQVVLPLLHDDCDLGEIMMACAEHRLDSVRIKTREGYAATVVAASPGYPGLYPKGLDINLPSRIPTGTSLNANGGIKTSGGRVLSVTGVGPTLEVALDRAYATMKMISFQGMQYRKDIGWRAIKMLQSGAKKENHVSYATAGVSIDAGNLLVEKIKPFIKETARIGSNADVGGFGGLFDIKPLGYKDPVLVAGTDGVGTKLKIAQAMATHKTIVAMSVNDLLVQGAEPLFFLDYYACGKLDVESAKDVIEGVATGCIEAGCALIGGETAEMPGMYQGDDYDLAGFAVGVVERHSVLPRKQDLKEGDAIIGLSSSGIHSNGYSLVRHVLAKSGFNYNDACPFDSSKTIGQVLLEPTKLYVKSLLPILRDNPGMVKAMAHITGGGFTENIPRILRDDLAVTIDISAWKLPHIFEWIKNIGNIENRELARTFNCGIGMIIFVEKSQKMAVLELLRQTDSSVKAYAIGHVTKATPGEQRVELLNIDACWK